MPNTVASFSNCSNGKTVSENENDGMHRIAERMRTG